MYLLDANVFIEAHRRYYSFDIVPSFWGNLKSLAQTSRICSIDKIQNELCPVTDNPDLLHQWTSEEFNEYFKSVEEYDVLASYSEIRKWLNSPHSVAQIHALGGLKFHTAGSNAPQYSKFT